MDPQEHSEEAIFLACIELPPEKREAFLEAACEDDEPKRKSVESLIRAHETEDAFLDSIPDPPILKEKDSTARTTRRDEKVGDRVGHYELIEILGEGAWGNVWRARQTEPIEREVALKILKVGLDTEEFLRRFNDERRVLAKLNYPHIATILDAGATKRGRPYLVMELVRGKPLLEYANDNRLSVEQRIHTFINVCKAVQYAHDKGVVHRDIKPSNVLVKEVQNEAIPKVIDFGIAKTVQTPVADRVDGDSAQSFMGTPYYCSPEQLEGRYEAVDARSDIYSLGALFYELITGRRYLEIEDDPDLKGEAIRKLLADALPTEPSSAFSKLSLDERESIAAARSTASRELERRLRGELDWVVMKCLHRDPDQRYQSALGLVNDLQAYLEDRPVSASAPGLTYRTRKFLKRNQSGSVAAAVATIAVVGSILLSIAIHSNRDAYVSNGLASEYEPVVPEYRQISFSGSVQNGVFSPNGRFLAYASSRSNTIVIHDLRRDEESQILLSRVIDDFPDYPIVRVVGWSPDSSKVVFAYGANEASATVLIDRNGTKARVLASSNLDWTIWPEGADSVLGLYSNLTAAPLVSIPIDGSNDQLAKWNFNVPDQFSIFRGHRLKNAVWLPVERRIFLTSVKLGEDRSHLWTMDFEGRDIRHLLELPFEIISAVMSPDGDSAYVLHSSGQQNAVTKFSLNDKNERRTLLHGDYESMSLSKDGVMLVASVQRSSNLALAESNPGGEWAEHPLTFGTWTHRNPSLSLDGRKIAYYRGDDDRSNIFTMDLEERMFEQITFFKASRNGFPNWSPDGETIAFGSTEGGERRIWLMNPDGSNLRPIEGPDLSPSLFVDWTPDSRLLYQVTENRIHRFLDPLSGLFRPMISKEEHFYGDQVSDLEDPRVGYTYSPRMSPDLSKIAVVWNKTRGEGLWIINKALQEVPSYQIAGAEQKTRGVIYQVIDAAAYRGKRVTLRFRAKTDPIWESPGARHFRARLVALKSIPDPVILDSDFLKGMGKAAMSTEWKEYRMDFTLPVETNFLAIDIEVFGVGEAELDDLSLSHESDTGAREPIEIENPSFEVGSIGALPVGWKAARPHRNFVFETAFENESMSNKVLKSSSSPLPNKGWRYEPLRWSDSGDVLYCRYRGSLWRYSMAEGTMNEIWRSSNERNCTVEDVSPDGRRLVYTVWNYESDIWTIENFDPEFGDALGKPTNSLAAVEFDKANAERPSFKVSNKSIAVLPFENLSPDPEDDFFADGVQEDILTNLARVNDLHVMSRTATLRYRGIEAVVGTIGQELGVRYLVEGSVRRSEDRVNVTVRLVDCENSTQLWVNEFDVSLDNVFRIQATVAKEIARKLNVVLTPQEIYRIEERLTENQKAYEYYVKYRQLVAQVRGKIKEKAELLEKAVAHDPEFAEAQARLAQVYIIWWDREDHRRNPELYEKAHQALNRARSLKPVMASLSYAEAMFATYEHNDLATAIDKLLEALELDHGFYTALRSIGRRCQRLGRLPEAQRYMEEAYRVDPTAQDTNYYLFLIYAVRGNWEEAKELVYRNIDGRSGRTGFWKYQLSVLDYFQSGDRRDFINAVGSVLDLDGTQLRRINILKAVFSGDYERAAQRVEKLEPDDHHYLFFRQQFSVSPPDLLSALLWFELDDKEKSLNNVRAARVYLENLIEADPNADPDYYSDLAVCYALEGNKEFVDRLVDATRARTQRGVWKYEFGVHCEINFAIAYLVMGEHEKAIETLENASEMEGPIFLNRELDLWFIFDRLRGNPRFDALLK